jgi:hypothetical protein
MLISAYDLYYQHLALPRSATTDITFVDSGGYETSDFQDLSTVFTTEVRPRKWNERKLKEVLNKWPAFIPAVFVSHDRRGPVSRQAEGAQRLLGQYPKHLHAFLVKPRTQRDPFVSVQDIVANTASIGQFQILGLTEKELGNSIIERMDNVSQIRLALDDAHLEKLPIHVFGSLDPITVPLYFLAGAEIFDGLTWLRFGYHDGAALYRQNSAVRQYGVHQSDDQVKLLTLRENLVQLSHLTMQMRRFLNHGDFAQLAPNGEPLKQAYELLVSRNPRVDSPQRVA